MAIITADMIFADDGYEDFIPEKEIGLLPLPDGSGWYWEQAYGDWLTSRVFVTKEEAVEAIEQDEDMKWGETLNLYGSGW